MLYISLCLNFLIGLLYIYVNIHYVNVIIHLCKCTYKCIIHLCLNYLLTTPPPYLKQSVRTLILDIMCVCDHILWAYSDKCLLTYEYLEFSRQSVMCNLVWRYVTAQQKDTESHPVTEDNINELRQDVYTFRYDLMRVLKSNGMNTRDIDKDQVDGNIFYFLI